MTTPKLGTPVIYPFIDFEDAVQAVLQFLHDSIGFQLWMLTRVNRDTWVVLSTCNQGYSVQAGDTFRWTDSFCSRMVRGEGPPIAPRSADVPAYARAPINDQVPIQAYVGIPIYKADGSLFGTLCAIDPAPQPQAIEHYLPLLELQSRLLTTILQAELDIQEQQRSLERLAAEVQVDPLTGVYNRRAWDHLLTMEEERCKRYGSSASVVVVDLDDLKRTNDSQGHTAGDRLLQAAAQVLQGAVRTHDVVARLGGDEFSILLVESSVQDTEQFVGRVRAALEDAQIQASVGWAVRLHQSTLVQTFEAADRAMYQEKLIRKSLMRTSSLTDAAELSS